MGVENIVVNFMCVDLVSDSCEKWGKENVEICCCWSWREGSWQSRDPRLGDALLVSFDPELLEVFVVWVESHLGCGCKSVACSPCPKDEVGCVDGCCGNVIFIFSVLCVEFKSCCINFRYELCIIACS